MKLQPNFSPASAKPSTGLGPASNGFAGNTPFSQTQPNPAFLSQFEAHYQDINSRAMAIHNNTVAHELAHQQTGGHLAGSPVYQMETIQVPDGRGGSRTIQYAAAGHVPIRMPGIPLTNDEGILTQILNDLKQVVAAALAPSDPSSTDLAVASTVGQLQSQAAGKLSQVQQNPLNHANQDRRPLNLLA